MNESDAERLRRVEEALGFSERAVEELSDEVLRLNRTVAKLLKRLEALERRLETIGEEEGEAGRSSA